MILLRVLLQKNASSHEEGDRLSILLFNVQGEKKPLQSLHMAKSMNASQSRWSARHFALLLIYRLGTNAETELKCPQWWMKAMGEEELEE